MSGRHEAVPPVGEEIHLPEPSVAPVVIAAAVTLILIGVTLSPILSAVGLIILVIATVSWVRHARRELDELPLEH